MSQVECEIGSTLGQRWDRNSVKLTKFQFSDSRLVININLPDLEPFPGVRTELLVQYSVHVDDYILIFGSTSELEKLIFSSIFCTNIAFLVELAQVVKIIPDTLESAIELAINKTENRATGSTSLLEAFVGARLVGIWNGRKLCGIQIAVIPMSARVGSREVSFAQWRLPPLVYHSES